MKLSVIGTGYVGLVTGVGFADRGNNVICVDNDPVKLEKLKKGIVPIYEPGLEIIFQRNIEKGRITFTDNLVDAVINSEIIFLCLPTPQGGDGAADLSYVMNTVKDVADIIINKNISDYKILVTKSTVPVGTCRQIKIILEKNILMNIDVVSNPEFLREGFAVEDFRKPDRIVIGSDSQKALDQIKHLYEPFVKQGNPIFEMNFESSELTKYASNSYLAARITFMNELANLCEKVGANVDLVRLGMGSDSRIGKRFLFPGVGYGGSCFPKDVKALIKTSEEYKSQLQILTTVDKMNEYQKTVLVEKVKKHFNDEITGKHFAVWGLSFKPNTDDMREAPSIVIINKLLDLGAAVTAYDPAAIEIAKGIFEDRIEFAEDEYSALDDADALLIVTEWNEFRNPDFEIIKSKLKNPLIFDGRNTLDPALLKELGFVYYSVGR